MNALTPLLQAVEELLEHGGLVLLALFQCLGRQDFSNVGRRSLSKARWYSLRDR